MANRILHITNGDSLTNYLTELGFKDDMLTWREMLCEGPTTPHIDSDAFYKLRSDFLNTTYGVKLADYDLKESIKIFDNSEQYSEINLWFEYDLFCHINLIAVISLLHQKEINAPLYLVCSGRVEGEKNLKGLSELTPDQLKTHYKNKIKLNDSDKDLALALWRTYCGSDHNIFKNYITQTSNFTYLTKCLKAHIKRFPSTKSGLCVLEENILKLIEKNKINSTHHLLGYCLNYQGYYGFGDTQYKRIIAKLVTFYDDTDDGLKLNKKGKSALKAEKNRALEICNKLHFGGVSRLDYNFSIAENKLVKSNFNVH